MQEANPTTPVIVPSRWPTVRLVYCTFIVSMLLILPAAYQATMINIPMDILQAFDNSSFYTHYGSYLSSSALDSLWGFTACVSSVACLLSAFTFTPLTRRFGRRKIAFVIGGLFIVAGSAVEFAAYYANSFELFILGQLLGAGFGWSFSYGVGTVFLTECCPPHLRGMMATYVNVGNCMGILVAYVLGLPYILGSASRWPWYALLTTVPALLASLLIFTVRESPKHLYIYRNEPEKARKSILLYYGAEFDYRQAFRDYDEEKSFSSRSQLTLVELWRTPYLRKALYIACAASIFNQVSGSSILFAYSDSMFEAMGLTKENSDLFSVTMAVPLPVLAVLSSLVVDRWGRRPMLLVGGALMILCLVVYVGAGLLHDYVWHDAQWLLYIEGTCIVLNPIIASLGPSAICYFVFSEIFPQSAVSVATGAMFFMNNVASILATLAFPPLQGAIGYFATIVVMIAPSTFCWVYLLLYLPETKNLPVSEIVARLAGRSDESDRAELIANEEHDCVQHA